MKENLYNPTELQSIIDRTKERLQSIDARAPHFEMKVASIQAQMDKLQQTMTGAIHQYREIGKDIRSFEIALALLSEEERKHFDFLDIPALKLEQSKRLESLLIVLDEPLPGTPYQQFQWKEEGE